MDQPAYSLFYTIIVLWFAVGFVMVVLALAYRMRSERSGKGKDRHG